MDNDYPTIVPTVLTHLQTCGARRPALLASDPATSYVRDTADEYTRWCAERGYEAHVTYVDAGITQSAGHDAATRLLRGAHRPDAVLTTLDQLAIGVIAAVDEMGWSVPDDVLVATLGDSAMITHSRVPITAVDLSPDELGRSAVDMLDRSNRGSVDCPDESSGPRASLRCGTARMAAATSIRRRVRGDRDVGVGMLGE